ncbi:hypothetical protein G7077_02245 [Sphingomonas piscis]|uniref:Uncharacterized protein n=1 Tax=Sphingomonas piscis TaxID=2714943 RepID=A0A6G7YMD8_9SPHN|nr:hypothetical protein [Sphingomonas piscis]QIK77909.1 hypothetical protein G7077_02245 [Sphingomonas piscis]
MIREPFSNGRKPTGENVGRLTARIYGIMAVTTLGTFGMLNAIYELFFRPDIFA